MCVHCARVGLCLMSTHISHMGLAELEISPYEWPARVGELTILLSAHTGYCAIVYDVDTEHSIAIVSLLDDADSAKFSVPLYDCVPTRKTPLDIVSQYTPTPQEFSHAVEQERSFPDFDSPALSKSRRSSTKKKAPAQKALKGAELVAALALLTPAQKEAIGRLVTGKKKGDK